MTNGVFRIAVFAAILVPFALPILGVADNPAALLARHKAYVGWAYGDGTLKSVRETISAPAPSPKPGATPAPFGPRDERLVVLRRGLLYRESDSEYGQSAGDEGFTGSVFWRANQNGFTVTRRAHDAAEALTADLIEAEALDDVPASARPSQTFDGTAASVVRIAPRLGIPADLFFGDDGALLGYTLDPDEPLARGTVHVASYDEFQAHKRYVSAYRYGESRRTYHVTDFQANAPVTDAELHPPAPRATWTFGGPHSVPITIRRGAWAGRSVFVDASVNGHVGHFLFDSGAGGTIITGHFAKIAGLKDVGRSGFTGVNGRGVSATRSLISTLSIGGNTLHDLVVDRTDGDDATIDGIVGFDVLAGSLVDVDLTTERLTILDPNGNDAAVVPGAYAFPVDLSEFHAGVSVKLANEVLSRVWIDTGDDFFVILPHALEGRHVAVIADRIFFGGVDGSAQEPANCVRLNEIQVGPYRYQNALSCFAPNDIFGKDGGLIGFDFLRHFNWTFDYPHNRLVLTPNGR
jgi:predicted aspartyl protease